MGFKEPIVAGATLIRDAIQSSNFAKNLAGWQLKQDGTAEINQLIARGDILIGDVSSVGNPAISVRDYLTRMAQSGSYVDQTFVGTNTLTTTPGRTIVTPDLLFAQIGFDITDKAIQGASVDISITAHFDCNASATTGAGGHVQIRYVYPDGSSDVYYPTERNGTDDGHFTISMSWSDNYIAEEIIAYQTPGGVSPIDGLPGPSFAARNTGSTAYTVNRAVWALSYQLS